MSRQPGPPSRRTAIIAALAVLSLLAGGFLFGRTGDGQPRPDRDDNPPAADSPRPRSPAGVAGPTGEAASVAVGLIPDEPGAVAAGLAYATASQHWLYFTDEEIEDAISEIATSVAAPRLTEDVVADISLARDPLAQADRKSVV